MTWSSLKTWKRKRKKRSSLLWSSPYLSQKLFWSKKICSRIIDLIIRMPTSRGDINCLKSTCDNSNAVTTSIQSHSKMDQLLLSIEDINKLWMKSKEIGLEHLMVFCLIMSLKCNKEWEHSTYLIKKRRQGSLANSVKSARALPKEVRYSEVLTIIEGMQLEESTILSQL